MNIVVKALLWAMGICGNEKEARRKRHRESIDSLLKSINQANELTNAGLQHPERRAARRRLHL